MKFRTIFILFNVVVVSSFLFIFFLPFALLGPGSSQAFWKGNWYLALLFLALIAGLNSFFLANRKTFLLVEREDWGELSAHLVGLMFPKGRFRSGRVRLLVNAYLLQSDIGGIERLESELASKRPDVLRKNALLFGVTRLLRGKTAEAEEFFAAYLGSKDVEARDWLRFEYGFSLVLQKKYAEALPYLEEGCGSKDAVLCLLAAYLLGSVGASAASEESGRAAAAAAAEGARSRLRKRYPSVNKWNREVERAKSEVHIVVLSKLIDDAGRWLLEPSASGTTSGTASGTASGTTSGPASAPGPASGPTET